MLTDELSVNEVVKRTYRYFYDDGLAELVVGLLFAVSGLVLFGWQSVGSASWITASVVASTVLLVLAAPFLLTWAIRAVKARVTYPRTGYVDYRAGEPQVGRRLLLGAIVVLVLGVLVLPQLNQMSFAVGIFLAFVLGIMGYRLGLRRFYAVAAAAAVTGILAAMLDAGEATGAALTFGVTGVLLLLSGGMILLTYLRQHPRPDEEAING